MLRTKFNRNNKIVKLKRVNSRDETHENELKRAKINNRPTDKTKSSRCSG